MVRCVLTETVSPEDQLRQKVAREVSQRRSALVPSFIIADLVLGDGSKSGSKNGQTGEAIQIYDDVRT